MLEAVSMRCAAICKKIAGASTTRAAMSLSQLGATSIKPATAMTARHPPFIRTRKKPDTAVAMKNMPAAQVRETCRNDMTVKYSGRTISMVGA